jgi:hypothetical protein
MSTGYQIDLSTHTLLSLDSLDSDVKYSVDIEGETTISSPYTRNVFPEILSYKREYEMMEPTAILL